MTARGGGSCRAWRPPPRGEPRPVRGVTMDVMVVEVVVVVVVVVVIVVVVAPEKTRRRSRGCWREPARDDKI